VHESTPASPRLRAAAALAMIVAVIAVFAWLTHSSVAGAASATPTPTAPAATQPYGSDHPCPKDEQGSDGSGSQQSAPNADL